MHDQENKSLDLKWSRILYTWDCQVENKEWWIKIHTTLLSRKILKSYELRNESLRKCVIVEFSEDQNCNKKCAVAESSKDQDHNKKCIVVEFLRDQDRNKKCAVIEFSENQNNNKKNVVAKSLGN